MKLAIRRHQRHRKHYRKPEVKDRVGPDPGGNRQHRVWHKPANQRNGEHIPAQHHLAQHRVGKREVPDGNDVQRIQGNCNKPSDPEIGNLQVLRCVPLMSNGGYGVAQAILLPKVLSKQELLPLS